MSLRVGLDLESYQFCSTPVRKIKGVEPPNTDCERKLSNGRRMDIWTATRTVLEKNPGIKAEYLIEKLRGKTGLSRSTIYEHLGSFELQGKVKREKGHYYLAELVREKAKQKLGLIPRLTMIRERYSEVPRLVLMMGIMIFLLVALGPPIIEEFSSVNMTSWNFTGHEVVRVVFPSLPFVLIMVWVIGQFSIGLDIAEILQKSKEAVIRTMRKQM